MINTFLAADIRMDVLDQEECKDGRGRLGEPNHVVADIGLF
jgi:hypothetical protein